MASLEDSDIDGLSVVSVLDFDCLDVLFWGSMGADCIGNPDACWRDNLEINDGFLASPECEEATDGVVNYEDPWMRALLVRRALNQLRRGPASLASMTAFSGSEWKASLAASPTLQR